MHGGWRGGRGLPHPLRAMPDVPKVCLPREHHGRRRTRRTWSREPGEAYSSVRKGAPAAGATPSESTATSDFGEVGRLPHQNEGHPTMVGWVASPQCMCPAISGPVLLNCCGCYSAGDGQRQCGDTATSRADRQRRNSPANRAVNDGSLTAARRLRWNASPISCWRNVRGPNLTGFQT